MTKISVVNQNTNVDHIFSGSLYRLVGGAFNSAPDSTMIWIRGRFQNIASKEVITKIIKKALSELDFDIMYLTQFDEDQPSSDGIILFSKIGKQILYNEHPMSNGKYFDATGDIFSKLHNEVQNSNINAIFAKPELFEYDDRVETVSKSQYRKDMLAPVSPSKPPEFKVSGLIWFIFVVFVVMILAWALIKLGPGSLGNRREDYSKYPVYEDNEPEKPFFTAWV